MIYLKMKLLILSFVLFSYEALGQINIISSLGVETFASTDVPEPPELLPPPTQTVKPKVVIQTQSASMASSEKLSQSNSLSNFNQASFENAIPEPPTQKLLIEAALEAPVSNSNQDTQSEATTQELVEPTNTIDPSLDDNNEQYSNQQNASEESSKESSKSHTVKTAIIISVSLAIVGIAVGGIFYGIPKFIKMTNEDISLTNPDWEAINQSRKQGLLV
jgi:hypothetical protein